MFTLSLTYRSEAATRPLPTQGLRLERADMPRFDLDIPIKKWYFHDYLGVAAADWLEGGKIRRGRGRTLDRCVGLAHQNSSMCSCAPGRLLRAQLFRVA